MQGETDDTRARRPGISARGRDGVLRLLAHGQSPAQIAGRAKPTPGSPRTAADGRTELKTILVDVHRALAEKTLTPPAEAAFLEKPGIDSTLDVANLASRAKELVNEAIFVLQDDAVATHSAGVSGMEGAGSYTALRYAEALIRQEDVLEALSRVDALAAPLHAALSDDDRRRLDEYLLYRNVKGRFETLDSLVGAWSRLVGSLARETSLLTYDEFTDRLLGRDSLETAMTQIAPVAREPLVDAVAPLDQSFVERTQRYARSIRRHGRWHADPWWWFRVPRAFGSQFEEQLAALTTSLRD
jgi:hypothetical protein